MRSMRNTFSLDPVDADVQRRSEPRQRNEPDRTFKTEDGSTDFLALSTHYQVPGNVIRAATELGGIDGKKAATVLADALKRTNNDVPAAVRSILGGNEDAAAAILDRAASLAAPPTPEPAPRQQAGADQPGFVGDVARMGAGGVAKGVGAVVEGVGRGVDAINPQEKFSGEMVLGEDGAPKLKITENAGPSSIVEGATEAADKLRGMGMALQQGVSDASFEAVANSTPDGDLFDPSTWSLGKDPSLRGYVMLSADVLGSMAPVIASALAGGPATAMAVGGAQSAGAGAELAREEIDAAAADLDENGLSRLERESAYYRELVASGVDRDEALRRTRHAAEQLAALFTAPVGALGGAATGAIVTKGVGALAGKGAATRIAGTAAISGAEEAVQETAETLAARKGVEAGSGLDVDLTEGTFGDALLGFLGGAITGGASGIPRRDGENEDPAATGLPAPDAPPLLPPPARQLPAPGAFVGTEGEGDRGAPQPIEQSSEAVAPAGGGQAPNATDTTSAPPAQQDTISGGAAEISPPAPNLERPPMGALAKAAARMDRSAPASPPVGSRVRVTTPEGADLEAVFDSEDAGGLNLKFENSPWRIPREDIAAGTVSVTPINPMAEDIDRRAAEAAKAFEDDAAFLKEAPDATPAIRARKDAKVAVTDTTKATPPVSGDTGTTPTEDAAPRNWDALGEQERRSLVVRAFPKSTEQGREALIAKPWGDIADQRVRSTITDALTKGSTTPAAAEEVDAAAQEVATDPSDAQKEAGNYKKGHVKVQGLDISIENAKGAERSGKDANGQPWSVNMPAHYGYIRRTEGADGDHVDVYLGDMPDSDAVYIVNQIDPDSGKFDEHKVILGTGSRAEATRLYEAGFSDGRGKERMGSMTATTMDGFKSWLKDGDQNKPTEPVRPVKPAGKAKDKTPSPASEDATPMARAVREAVARGKATHTTQRGKALTGYVVREVEGLRLVPKNAKEIDKYAFRKDGGFFLREDAVSDAFPDLLGGVAVENQERVAKGSADKAEGSAAPKAEGDASIKKPAPSGNDAPMGKHLGVIDASDDTTSDVGRESPQKNAFLKDATRWARKVAAILEEDGYTRPTNAKGKTLPPVRANLGGVVGSGDVYMEMRTPDDAYSVFLTINADSSFGRSRENGVFVNFQIKDGGRFVGNNRYPGGALAPSEMAEVIRGAVITAHATDTKRNAPKAPPAGAPAGPRVLVNYVGRDGKTDAERGGPLPPENEPDPTIPPGYELTYIKRATGDEARANGFKPGEPHKAVVKRNSPYGVYDAIEATRAAAIASALRKAQGGAKAKTDHAAIFRKAFNGNNSLDDMRNNPDLADVAAHADWLGSLTPEQWDAIAPHFDASDNPFHSAGSMDVEQSRSKLEAALPEVAKPAARAPEPAPAPTYGAQNKLVSADRAAEIRAQLIEKLKNQTNAGIDPQILALGAELAVFHIEAGSRKFVDMTRAIAADLGMEPKDLKRYLRSWYNGARDMMEDSDVSVDGMDNADTVRTLLQSGAIDSLSAKLPDAAPSDTITDADTEPSQDNEAANDPSSDEVRVDPTEPLEDASPESVSPNAGGQDAEPAGADQGREDRGPRRRDDGNGDAGARSGGGRKGRSVPRPRKLKDDAQPALDFEAQVSEAVATTPNQNFVITADLRLGQGGPTEKFNDNVAAIETLKSVEAEKRPATAAEQAILARYVGWGGLKNAFRVAGTGDVAKGWETKVEQLEALLEPEELKAARNSTRAAHYTSETVVNGIWKLAERLGFNGGAVLEPSSGIGNFLGLMPQSLRGKSKVMAVEYDSITARIARHLYPRDVVYHSGFQDVPLPEGQFALAIGNPPFGTDSLYFKHLPAVNRKSIHNQFFQASMHAVAPDGLMAMVVSRYLMDAKDAGNRKALARMGTLEAAIRLPDTAFQENARTEVVTDILAFRRHSVPQEVADAALARIAGTKQPEYDAHFAAEVDRLEANFRTWLNVSEFSDPSGSGETLAMNDYFHQRKSMVLGDIAATGTMRRKNELNVTLPAEQIEQRLSAAIERIPAAPRQDAIAARTQASFDALAEAMGLAVRGAEPGAVHVNDKDQLIAVVEQHDADDNAILKEIEITADTPYTNAYFLGTDGKWRREVDAVDEKGNKVKKVNADGRKTNLNVKEVEVIEDLSTVHSASKWGAARVQQLRDMLPIRDTFRRQVELESQDAPADRVEANRKKLAEAYRAFKDAHGPLHQPRIRAIADQMPDGGLILAVEDITSKPDAKRLTVKDADILQKRVLFPPAKITEAKSLEDAISISLSETGGFDLERMAALRGTDVDGITQALSAGESPRGFFDPEQSKWVSADEYLSGEVRRKLAAAEAAGLEGNIKALEKVAPEPWGPAEITPSLGANWIPREVYAEYLRHIGFSGGDVRYQALTNTYSILSEGEPKPEWKTTEDRAWSTEKILEAVMNSGPIRVTYKVKDGESEKTVVDEDATRESQQKAEELQNEFQDWVFAEDTRRDKLVQIFNNKYNTRVTRQRDGSHLKLPGKNPAIRMRRHQNNAIWRGITDQMVLYDHVVGAGKTFTAIARIMERRRMGLTRKPLVAVPNHLTEQWGKDWRLLYPGAKLLVAGKSDFEKSNRRRMFARIAAGDYDGIIIGHSQVGMIPIDPAIEEQYLEEELRAAIDAIEEAKEQAAEDGTDTGWRKPVGVAEAERLVNKLEERMAKLRAKTRDRLINFQQMGIDDLTVDEAHEFKNLAYSSRMTNTAGMGNKAGSQKAMDLHMKMRALHDAKHSAAFLTGTPISNSVAEMYLVLRNLVPNQLREMGLENFDAWRTMFVTATSEWEPTEAGGLKEVVRLGREWTNMRTLMDLYYSVSDAVTIDDIKLAFAEDNNGAAFPIPRVRNVKEGETRRLVPVSPGPSTQRILDQVVQGFDSLPHISDIQERNAERLRLMDRARKIALDPRAVDPTNAPDPEGGKIAAVTGELLRLYREWDADKGTQIVFLDRSVPKAKGDEKVVAEYDAALEKYTQAREADDEAKVAAAIEALDKFDAGDIAARRAAINGGWNAYDDIKKRLVEAGIPENEIAFVQSANNDKQKAQLFQKVKDGDVRILIGSTPRMGAGTNVQDRLVALHHVDVTWKPSDIEQREGRIIRQGNALLEKYGMEDFAVEVIAYATERTVDAKMWDLNGQKLKAINGIRKYDGAFSMEFEDADSASMAEMAALATGNPLMVDRIKLEGARKKLMGKQRTFNKRRNAQRAELAKIKRDLDRAPAEIAYQTNLKTELAKQTAAMKEAEAARAIQIGDTSHRTAAAALTAIDEAIAAQQEGGKKRWKLQIAGLDVTTQDDARKLVRDAFGTPGFAATISGKDYIDIQKAAEALAGEYNNTRAAQAELQQKSFSTATVNGFPLEVVVAPGYGARGFERQIAMIFEGEEAFANYDYKEDDLISTAQFRSYLEKVTEQATVDRVERRIANAERLVERAETRIPELEREVAREFPEQKELDDTNQRLDTVVAALGGMQGKEDEKASYPGPETRETIAILTGQEIAATGDIRDLRRKAFQWYRTNLAGKNVYSAALGGHVRFARRGANKSVFAKGEDLLRLIPALQDIIANGQLVRTVPAKDKARFDTLHTIAARVELEGKPKDIVVTIRETPDARYHYDISRDMSGGARFRLDRDVQLVPARVLQTASLEANTAILNIVEQRADVNLDAAQSAMERALKEAGIAGKVTAELVEGLAVAGRAAQGRYVAGSIAIDPNSDDVAGTARHEVVHALRDAKLWGQPYGLFTAGEWQRLVRAARRDKALLERIKETYGGQSAAAQIEEAIAERYRRWRAGDEADGALVKLFKRMRSALEAIANGLAGAGFRSEAATFRAIAEGEIGARGRDIAPGRGSPDPRARLGFTPQAPYVTMKGKKGGLAALTKSLMTRAMIGVHDGDLSLLALVPGRGLLAEMGKHLPGAQRYLSFKEKMDALRNELHNEMDATAKAWRKVLVKDRAANKAMMDLMHESTIRQIDPSLPFVGQSTPRDHELAQKYRGTKTGDSAMERIREDQERRALYRGLKQRYDALPPEFQSMYRKVRDEYTKMANRFEDAILANAQKAMEIGVRRAERAYHKRMEEISEEGLRGKARRDAIAEARQTLENAKASNRFAAQARLNALRAAFESNRLSGPYFPLARFGKLYVTVRDDLGQVVSFSRFEKEPDQTAFAAEMKRRGYSVEVGAMAEFSPRKVVDPSFVADVEELMGEIGASTQVMDEIWQRWLHTLPDMSVRTNRIHRKGTPGFDGDAFRAFGFNMSHGAHQLARLTYGIDLQFALEDTRADARKAPDPVRADLIVNEMEKRHAFVMNPTGSQLAQNMTTAAFIWYLGITPAAAISNITQTTVVGIPILGAFHGKGGMAKASKEITRALGDFTTGKGHAAESRRLTADERSAMQEAYDRGIVDKSQAHDLTGVGETGIEYDRVRTAVMEKVAFFFHHAERMNREITFLAAYRMARDKGMGHEQAITTAGDLTWRSHFDYQNTSRPRIMQNDFLRVMLVFKNFQTNMLWRLFRDIHQSFHGSTPEAKQEARRQLIGITASMFLHAGIKGVWGYALLKTLLGMFLPGDGEEIEQEIEQALLSVLPNEAVAAFLQGVPGTLMGIDVTNRWGMPELWFRSPGREMEGQDQYNYWVQEIIGAVPGIAEGMFRGTQMLADGEAWKGFESMVPKFVRDMSRSVRYSYEGATTYNGNPIIDDFTAKEIIAQFSGFTPARLARQYELNARDKNAEQRIMKARGRALREARKDVRTGSGLSKSTLEKISDFNAEYPFYAITKQTLMRSIKSGQRASQNTKDGVYINPRLAPHINAKRAHELYD